MHFFLASALKCWNCDDVYDKFCNDNWDLNEVTEEVRAIHYLPCFGEKCLKSVTSNGDGKFPEQFELHAATN